MLPLLKDFRQQEEIKIIYQYEITEEKDEKLYEILNKEEPVDDLISN